jgi:hypothetical protein
VTATAGAAAASAATADAVGPLMQLAEAVSEGSPAQDAIRAALAQLGLVYLLPAPPAAAVGGSTD